MCETESAVIFSIFEGSIIPDDLEFTAAVVVPRCAAWSWLNVTHKYDKVHILGYFMNPR